MTTEVEVEVETVIKSNKATPDLGAPNVFSGSNGQNGNTTKDNAVPVITTNYGSGQKEDSTICKRFKTIHQSMLCLSKHTKKIKSNICSQLKKTDFNSVTATDIKKSNALNKELLGEYILKSVKLSDDVCSPKSFDTISESSKFVPSISLDSVNELVSKVVLKTLDITHVNEIQQQVNSFQTKLNSFLDNKSSCSNNVEKFDNLTSNFKGDSVCDVSHGNIVNLIDAVDDYITDFISDDSSESLLQFLDTISDSFSKNVENGHSVVEFGYPYHYTGSKASVPPESLDIPDPIQVLIDDIIKRYPNTEINSCLINKYDCGPDSELPPHADDEPSIEPGSTIFTVSLGFNATIKYTSIHDGNVVKKEIAPKSLYLMSRLSQSFWRHEIEKCETQKLTDIRYSITLRHISQKYLKSTVIIGDSNTNNLRFGEGKGTFGHNIPGRRICAYRIDDINPTDCCGYKHIFIHTGINDIKQDSVTGPTKVTECFKNLLRKVDEIRTLCPKSRLYISPMLPTKDRSLNYRCVYFNKLLFDYVNRSAGKVLTHDFREFCDQYGSLSVNMGRINPNDKLHLGFTGVLKLVKIIRKCVYGKKFRESTQRLDKDTMLYSTAAASSDHDT